IAEGLLQGCECRDGSCFGAQDTRSQVHGPKTRTDCRRVLVVCQAALGPDKERDPLAPVEFTDTGAALEREYQAQRRSRGLVRQKLPQLKRRGELGYTIAPALLAGGDADAAPVLQLTLRLARIEPHHTAQRNERDDAPHAKLGRLLEDPVHAL